MKTPGQKRAETNKAKDPLYYSKLSKKRKKPFLHFTWLKQSDPERLKSIAKSGGKSRSYEVYEPGTFRGKGL